MDETDFWMRAVLWVVRLRRQALELGLKIFEVWVKYLSQLFLKDLFPRIGVPSRIALLPPPPPPLLKIRRGEGLLLILRLPGQGGVMQFYQPLWAPFVSLSMLTNRYVSFIVLFRSEFLRASISGAEIYIFFSPLAEVRLVCSVHVYWTAVTTSYPNVGTVVLSCFRYSAGAAIQTWACSPKNSLAVPTAARYVVYTGLTPLLYVGGTWECQIQEVM
jgi:hypothetical protein